MHNFSSVDAMIFFDCLIPLGKRLTLDESNAKTEVATIL